MKKIIISIVLFAILVIITGSIYKISENNKTIDENGIYSNEDIEEKIEIKSLKQVREEAEGVIKDLKAGKYKKLEADSPYVYITDEDVLYNIIETSNTKFKKMSLLEIIEGEYNVMKSLLGDDLRSDDIVDDTSWSYVNNSYDLHYPTYDETVNNIKNGTYTPNEINIGICEWPYLAYTGVTAGEDMRYCHVPPDMNYVVFMRGKLFEKIDGITDDPELDSEFEIVKRYYKNSDGLEDEYEMLNGKTSVNAAINYVENYFENLYPYNIFPEIKEMVHHVNVLQNTKELGEGKYVFEFTLTKKFAGLVADVGSTRGMVSGEDRVCTKVIMIETDKVDMRIGTGNANEMKKDGKEIGDVVSLNSVLERISARIGKNSKYTVNEISTIYRRDAKERQLYKQHFIGIPHWLVRCVNATDNSIVTFYINMEDGELSYVQEEYTIL